MTNLIKHQFTTEYIGVGQAIVINAMSGVGSYVLQGQAGANQLGSPVQLNGNNEVVGPFATPQTVRVNCESGVITTEAVNVVPQAFEDRPAGHVLYADGAVTVAEAQTILAGVRTQVTIDGLGSQTELRWKGSLPDNVWLNNVNGIDEIGQSLEWRLTFSVRKTATGNDQLLVVDQDIGSDPLDTDSLIIAEQSYSLTKGQNIEQKIKFDTVGYGKNTFLANGAKFYITPDADVEVWKKAIFIRDGGIPPIIE